MVKEIKFVFDYSNYDLLYQSNFNPIKHAIDLSLISVISNQNFTDNYSQNVSKTFSPFEEPSKFVNWI